MRLITDGSPRLYATDPNANPLEVECTIEWVNTIPVDYVATDYTLDIKADPTIKNVATRLNSMVSIIRHEPLPT